MSDEKQLSNVQQFEQWVLLHGVTGAMDIVSSEVVAACADMGDLSRSVKDRDKESTHG